MNPRSDAGFGNAMVHRLKRTGGIHDYVWPMFLQSRGDPAAIERQREKAGPVPAKGASLVDGPSSDQHFMSCGGETPRNAPAEAAIAAKEQYAAHRMRRACSAVGIQQVDR